MTRSEMIDAAVRANMDRLYEPVWATLAELKPEEPKRGTLFAFWVRQVRLRFCLMAAEERRRVRAS